jgi:hypothetical protein
MMQGKGASTSNLDFIRRLTTHLLHPPAAQDGGGISIHEQMEKVADMAETIATAKSEGTIPSSTLNAVWLFIVDNAS